MLLRGGSLHLHAVHAYEANYSTAAVQLNYSARSTAYYFALLLLRKEFRAITLSVQPPRLSPCASKGQRRDQATNTKRAQRGGVVLITRSTTTAVSP